MGTKTYMDQFEYPFPVADVLKDDVVHVRLDKEDNWSNPMLYSDAIKYRSFNEMEILIGRKLWITVEM